MASYSITHGVSTLRIQKNLQAAKRRSAVVERVKELSCIVFLFLGVLVFFDNTIAIRDFIFGR